MKKSSSISKEKHLWTVFIEMYTVSGTGSLPTSGPWIDNVTHITDSLRWRTQYTIINKQKCTYCHKVIKLSEAAPDEDCPVQIAQLIHDS